MIRWLLVFLACCLPFLSRSEEQPSIRELSFPKSDVRDVLAFYHRLTGKPVLAALDLHALVTIERTEPISAEGAVELIRKTLLERYGIELRTSDRGETLVTWSQDPQYPRRSDEAEVEGRQEPPADPPPAKKRIRIIRR